MIKKFKKRRVGFFLYSPGDKMVLIHKRDDKEGVESRGKWDYFGGSFEPIDKNKANHALARELYEELGISVDKDDIKFLAKNGNEAMYCVVFPKYKTRAFKLDEGAGFAWFSFEEALALNTFITDEARKYLKILQKNI